MTAISIGNGKVGSILDLDTGVRVLASKYAEDTMALKDWNARVAAGDLCVHCQELPEYHVDGQCMFDASTYSKTTYTKGLLR